MTPEEQKAEYEANFPRLSKRLLEWGWLFSGRMSTYEVTILRKLLDSYDARPSGTELRDFLYNLDRRMLGFVFALDIRAFTVLRAHEHEASSRFSHLIELATFHYFKQDYLSCSLSLLPALEGILLSRLGWKPNERKPSIKNLIKGISSVGSARSDLDNRTRIYQGALSEFLAKWIFCDHLQVDSEVTFLNRHYALHCMGEESYYTASDCHRLFNFFDLYFDLVECETGRTSVFVPSSDFSVRRQQFYERLILNFGERPLFKDSVADIRNYEEQLLQEHAGYKTEAHVPSWLSIAQQREADLAKIISEANGAASRITET